VRGDWSLAYRAGPLLVGTLTGAVERTAGAEARGAGADARDVPDEARETAVEPPEDVEARRSPPRESAARVAPANARLLATTKANRDVVVLMDTPLGRCNSNRPASDRLAKPLGNSRVSAVGAGECPRRTAARVRFP
jgi:hypothetical protein